MNSSRFRSKMLPTKAAIAAALVAAGTLAFPASAQDAAGPGFLIPGAEQPQKPTVVLPQGATIDGAKEKVRAMATEAGRSLEDLIGTAVTPRIEAEVGEMAARQRRIMILEDQVREAKLAKELWVELNGETDEASNEELERLHAEKASLEAELVRLSASQARGPANDPDPVVSEITGAAGSMRAKVLVPYMGEFMVERGASLPNGMKVSSIAKTGVVVTKDNGDRKTLAFGTSVPRARITAQPAPASAQGGNNIIQQIGQ